MARAEGSIPAIEMIAIAAAELAATRERDRAFEA
jgi:hypothetical protein